MNNEFKVGDKVLCISKPRLNRDIKINNVYTIKSISRTHVALCEHIIDEFYKFRFLVIKDNALNRLLYPEAFNEV